MKNSYNQTDYERVNRLVIEPLKRHYGADFDVQTMDDYIDALKRFSESALQEAMQEILMTNKRKPTIAHIASACHEAMPKERTSPEGEKYLADLRGKYDKAFDDAKIFTGNFMHSMLGLEAKKEGWAGDLKNYVFEQASLQAHNIAKLNNGFDANDLFNYGGMKARNATDEEIKTRKQRELNYALRQTLLNVEPPADLIAEWKTTADWKKKQKQQAEMLIC